MIQRRLALAVIFAAGDVALAQVSPEPANENVAALREDMAAIEGAWQRKTHDRQGREITVTKVHTAGVSVVTARDADGKIIERHRSEYQPVRTGKVRIFRYSNRTVTDGPGAGQSEAGPFEYLYRVDGDRFIEIHGMLIDDKGPPAVLVWDRVPQEPGDRDT